MLASMSMSGHVVDCGSIWNNNPAGTPCKSKKWFSAPQYCCIYAVTIKKDSAKKNRSHGVMAKFFEGGSADLAWWPDLTLVQTKKSQNVCNERPFKIWKFKLPISSGLAKTHEKPGASEAPSPAPFNNRVNSLEATVRYLLNLFQFREDHMCWRPRSDMLIWITGLVY